MAKRSARERNGTPSQRQLRVGELIRHELSSIFARGNHHDPELAGTVITVPEVRMSPDLKIATVYVMPLGGKGQETIVKTLARSARDLRQMLAGSVTLRYLPDLRFRLDTSFDEAGRIKGLLASVDAGPDT